MFRSRNALVLTTMLTFASASFAVGVGGVNVGTNTDAQVGSNGLLGTGIGTNVNADTETKLDLGAKATADSDVHDRVMNSTEAAAKSDVDLRSNAETGVSEQNPQDRKKRMRNLRALKSSANADIDSNLSTTPAPLGVNSKAGVGLGVESRVPGATGR